MGRRTNPFSLRLRGLINWPSNVSHPWLQSYIRHIFQHSFVAIPQIRSSTSGIWVNVTLLQTEEHPLNQHPKVIENVLDFRGANLQKAAGRLETRTRKLTHKHSYFAPVFAKIKNKSLIAAASRDGTPNEVLQIYRDAPIHLKINIINNPLLSADIASQHVASALKMGVPISRIFKTYLQKLSSE
ncbi:hypothetical protein HDV06_003003 [Boothiomyces sp. JEL0866]|nr:hypothetical protein HDV06_000399 [Boothiomyces sp. JEL0866]KAJ3322459.1 hypothetical protein HDV06_003003 [Boothiomyces sp. JEL0866]